MDIPGSIMVLLAWRLQGYKRATPLCRSGWLSEALQYGIMHRQVGCVDGCAQMLCSFV